MFSRLGWHHAKLVWNYLTKWLFSNFSPPQNWSQNRLAAFVVSSIMGEESYNSHLINANTRNARIDLAPSSCILHKCVSHQSYLKLMRSERW